MNMLFASAVGTFLISAVLTGIVRSLALAQGMMDVPNQRSSHTSPTPRGGGIAIVIAMALVMAYSLPAGLIDFNFAMAAAGGLAIAAVGFIDDRRPVPPILRLIVHFTAACCAMWWLGGLPSFRVAGHVVALGGVGYVLGSIAIVWTLNLFNFMDGIDGIAATEAAFVCLAGGTLQLLAGGGSDPALACFSLAAAAAGFLWWNWAPARIFMGDVGSGFVGFFIGVLAIRSGRVDGAQLFVWLILGGVFFVDASVTLVRRLARQERVHEAHRTHAYQWLARRWQSHSRVVFATMAINVLWLLPSAVAATKWPSCAPWIAVGSLAPLVLVAIYLGSGRKEDQA
jgi:Fuc2NAc and GlcNAc transferase